LPSYDCIRLDHSFIHYYTAAPTLYRTRPKQEDSVNTEVTWWPISTTAQ